MKKFSSFCFCLCFCFWPPLSILLPVPLMPRLAGSPSFSPSSPVSLSSPVPLALGQMVLALSLSLGENAMRVTPAARRVGRCLGGIDRDSHISPLLIRSGGPNRTTARGLCKTRSSCGAPASLDSPWKKPKTLLLRKHFSASLHHPHRQSGTTYWHPKQRIPSRGPLHSSRHLPGHPVEECVST